TSCWRHFGKRTQSYKTNPHSPISAYGAMGLPSNPHSPIWGDGGLMAVALCHPNAPGQRLGLASVVVSRPPDRAGYAGQGVVCGWVFYWRFVSGGAAWHYPEH